MVSCPTQPLGQVQYEARSFDVEALKCLACGVPMVVLAFLTDPTVVSKILAHLGLPTAPPPLTPARLAAQEELFPDATDEASQDPDDHRSPETGSARGPP